MASSFNFYTLKDMETASITSVTSEASGNPIEYAFDNNMDTGWKPTSTADQNIIIDFGAAVTMSGWALFLRNYTSALATTTIQVSHSDNGTTWAAWSGAPSMLTSVQNAGEPLFLKEAGVEVTKRYFRIEIRLAGLILEVGQFFLFRKRAVATGNIYPEDDTRRFDVKVQNLPGQRTFKRLNNRIPVRTFNRTWLLISEADRTALQQVYDESFGRLFPLIMQEDSDAPIAVEILSLDWSDKKLQHQMYKPTLQFRSLPYAEAGKGY